MDSQIIFIIVWAAIFIIALITELLTDQLVSIWFSIGAIFALIFVAIKQIPPWVSVIVFVVVSAASLAVFIVFFREKFLKKDSLKTNIDSFIGKQVKLLKDVKNNLSEVKINDTVWSVECQDECREGSTVIIKEIRGNHLIVERVEILAKGETK